MIIFKSSRRLHSGRSCIFSYRYFAVAYKSPLSSYSQTIFPALKSCCCSYNYLLSTFLTSAKSKVWTMSDSTGVPSPSDVGFGEPQTPPQVASPILSSTDTQSPNSTPGSATSSTADPSPEHPTPPPASNPPEDTSASPANSTTPESALRKRRSKLLKQFEPYVKTEGKSSAKRVKQDAGGLFRRSLAWIYAHSLGLVIAFVGKQCQGAYEGGVRFGLTIA